MSSSAAGGGGGTDRPNVGFILPLGPVPLGQSALHAIEAGPRRDAFVAVRSWQRLREPGESFDERVVLRDGGRWQEEQDEADASPPRLQEPNRGTSAEYNENAIST